MITNPVRGAVSGHLGVNNSSSLDDYNQARNKAQNWLKENGWNKSEIKTPSRFNSEANPFDGMKDSQGRRFRVEFDQRNGAHINVYNKKLKGPHFKFKGNQSIVNKIIKRLK